MKLNLKVFPNFDDKQLAIIEELSFHTAKLYNIANYHNHKKNYLNYIQMEKLLKNNWHNKFLHSHNYQQCLKVLK